MTKEVSYTMKEGNYLPKEGNFCLKNCNYPPYKVKYLAKEDGNLTKLFSGMSIIFSFMKERDNFPSREVFLVSWCLSGK